MSLEKPLDRKILNEMSKLDYDVNFDKLNKIQQQYIMSEYPSYAKDIEDEEIKRGPQKKIDKAQLSECIKSMVEGYGKSPKQINKRQCGFFAMDVVDKLNDKSLKVITSREDKVFGTSPPFGGKQHVSIKYKGKYYDAETPCGVKDVSQLPFFKRAKRSSK